MNNLTIPVEIDLRELVSRITREDALSLITALDEKFLECDFTLKAIKKLVKSLENDMTKEEIKQDLSL